MKRARSFEAGFTLVEMLMVVFIIGLVSAIAVMNMPAPISPLREDGMLLQRDVNALSKRAVLTGIPHALEIQEGAYNGVYWQGEDWVKLTQYGRALSEDISITLDEAPIEETDARIIFDPVGIEATGLITLFSRGDTLQIFLGDADARAGERS